MENPSTFKSFFKHLLIIILLSIGIITAFFLSLSSITRHNESIQVPNLVGQNSEQAIAHIKALGLDPVVLDSVFFDSLPRLSIVSQTPAAMAKVKKDRIVYLTINRLVAPTVQMPNLTGYSLNSAILLLKSFGLRLGKYSYTANLVKDAVVKQQIGDSDITVGTRIPMGTAINLIVGDGSGNEMMSVPDIVGMRLSEAKDYISSMNCSIGEVTADMDVKLADSAYIYKQDPATTITNEQGQTGTVKMKIGGAINVWVGNNPSPVGH